MLKRQEEEEVEEEEGVERSNKKRWGNARDGRETEAIRRDATSLLCYPALIKVSSDLSIAEVNN